ncbi:rho guanine nucleotide exchange factor 8-like isoform X2 [Mangifera indica]|uniref:rho guanine nucleotide exchange factor 8-like isoform X2 n=1 Tax=Mangifera indica TaxID=29780 RepID=UPI001CFC060B|nr:rho guanine nucleotide exchange factor 8-like isoform X2 [Mangifera indica]
MVKALELGNNIHKSISKKLFDSSGKQSQSMVSDNGSDSGGNFDKFAGPAAAPPEKQPQLQPSDMELMKEKFAKLLLGEDMSGGGKGVSSALALSNAITNLAASTFGEQRKLEPMAPEIKARWKKEINWLLSVTDHIVEFVASQQKSKDGTNMEVMMTVQRKDLRMDIPALRKLDAMLIDCLDSFGNNDNEFWYASKKEKEAGRDNDKWWIPTVKVPPNGLSDSARKWIQSQKESVNQVHKAAMAINAQVLSEMEIPESYIESLPKNGRSSLGDSIYKSITVEAFDPDQFLSTMDLSTEHSVLDLKNKIEASVVIWKRKMNHKDGKSSWSSGVSLEKRELLEERAETILLLLKHRFPGSPQSALDISKIQYNRDVGQAILESYSRVIESLAFTVMSRIEDVLYADLKASGSESNEVSIMESPGSSINKPGEEETIRTLSDFMDWEEEQTTEVETETGTGRKSWTGTGTVAGAYLRRIIARGNKQGYYAVDNEMVMSKPPPPVVTPKKSSYLERLENLTGPRSPTARY